MSTCAIAPHEFRPVSLAELNEIRSEVSSSDPAVARVGRRLDEQLVATARGGLKGEAYVGGLPYHLRNAVAQLYGNNGYVILFRNVLDIPTDFMTYGMKVREP